MNLKEELIKFLEWYEPELHGDYEYNVDLYLRQEEIKAELVIFGVDGDFNITYPEKYKGKKLQDCIIPIECECKRIFDKVVRGTVIPDQCALCKEEITPREIADQKP